MEIRFSVFGGPVVDGVAPRLWAAFAVKNEARFLVWVIDVHDRDGCLVAVWDVSKDGSGASKQEAFLVVLVKAFMVMAQFYVANRWLPYLRKARPLSAEECALQ